MSYNNKKNNNNAYKDELNKLWAFFMISYDYSKYYTNNNDENNKNNYSKIKAIKQLNHFFQKYNITILSNSSLYSNNNNILHEPKLWIMYIITNIRNNHSIDHIFNLFEYSINNNCDVISMFEFFLIYLSEISENELINYCNNQDFIITFPESFLFLYRNNKRLLSEIFKEEDNKDEDLFIIFEDYLNSGMFTILTNKENKYIIMPLKQKFEINEKHAVNNILQNLFNSKYKNFEYHPFDPTIYNQIMRNKYYP